MLNGYAIAFASLLVLFGRLAERRSRELGFLVGVLVFTLASAACGLATSVEALVAFRVVQGRAPHWLTPASLSLVLATAPDERRHSSVRAWTAVGGLAAALGPVVGGLLVAVDWRWVFSVNVPIGLGALYVGWRRLPNARPSRPAARRAGRGAAQRRRRGSPSRWCGARSGAGIRPRRWGRSASPRHWSPSSSGTACAPATHSSSPRSSVPAACGLLDRHDAVLGLVRRDAPVARAVDAGRLGLVRAGDRPGRRAGAAHGPAVLLLVAGRLIARFGPAPVVTAGMTIFAAGLGWWAAAVQVEPDYVGTLLGGMLLTGIGVGLTLPTLMATAAGSLPPWAFATGSAVVNMLRQVGLALGVALLVALLGRPESSDAALTAFRTRLRARGDRARRGRRRCRPASTKAEVPAAEILDCEPAVPAARL